MRIFRCALSSFGAHGFGSVAMDGIGNDGQLFGNMSTQAVMNLIRFTDLEGSDLGSASNVTVGLDVSEVKRFAIPTRVMSDLTNNSGVKIVLF